VVTWHAKVDPVPDSLPRPGAPAPATSSDTADTSREMRDSIAAAAEAVLSCRHAVCLTGAGMSVESGIRPFRGPGGVWTEHGEPPLDDYSRFLADPAAYWRQLLQPEGHMRELRLAIERAAPNEGYRALVEMERLGVLQYIITQNIDGLHRKAGSRHVAEIHGSCQLCRCTTCGERFDRSEVDVSTLPPRCAVCGGVMKEDVVVFGEPIPEDVGRVCVQEASRADCMLLVGTSAYVYPAAGLPRTVAARGGILIEVGPHPTEITDMCDIVVRGTAAAVLPALAQRLASRLAG
jgi:NAD-dependent deacetylase